MARDYHHFIHKIHKSIGINLSLYKEAQMKRRLTSLRNKRGYDNFNSYYRAIMQNETLMDEFINRITINVTEFYRNPKRWDILHKKILPIIIESKSTLNIWSAACSTGEEPYTVAMLMQKHFPMISTKILATDIDEVALELAKQGIYKEDSLKDLPSYYKKEYFKQKNGLYHINPSIKQKVTFKKHDLLQDPYPKRQDLIICRNVLIYFTDEAKNSVYKNFSHSLIDDGVLFVGSTEQIFNPKDYDFHVLETFFYQKRKEG